MRLRSHPNSGDVRVSSNLRKVGVCFAGSGFGIGLNILSKVLYHEHEGPSMSGSLPVSSIRDTIVVKAYWSGACRDNTAV